VVKGRVQSVSLRRIWQQGGQDMDARILIFIAAISIAITYAMASQAAESLSPMACPVNLSANHSSADPNLASWIRKRALYLHDLKISSFEEKHGLVSKTDLNMADDLADAGLYIAYAEADRLGMEQAGSADVDMQLALGQLDRAYGLASGDIKKKIEMAKTTLESTRDTMRLCQGTDFRQQREEYEALRKDIQRLVNDIG